MAHGKIGKVTAPNLILAPREYDQRIQDQLTNELRLYFNRLNTYLNSLADTSGGSGLSFPHIVAYSNAEQFAGGDDTPTLVAFNNALNNVGFIFNPDGTASALHSGTYKVEYRLQALNTDNVVHDVVVWMQVNGVDVPDSATKYSIPARKSATEFTYNVLASFISYRTEADDKFALYWATNQAYESGVQDGVYLEYEAAQTSPYEHPEIPSAYGVIQYIGRE